MIVTVQIEIPDSMPSVARALNAPLRVADAVMTCDPIETTAADAKNRTYRVGTRRLFLELIEGSEVELAAGERIKTPRRLADLFRHETL